MTPELPPVIRRAIAFGLLGASALGATGRLEAAFALTLGALVAIVSALWLSGLVGRLTAADRSAGSTLGWKFALGGALRYAAFAVLVFWGVKTVPAQLSWLLVGASVVVASIVVEGAIEGFGRKSKGASS